MILWLALVGFVWAAGPAPSAPPSSPEARPLSAEEKRYHRKLLQALDKMANSSPEARRDLGHLLEEANQMSVGPYPVQFMDLGSAWGACRCFAPDVRTDFIRLSAKLLGTNPYLAYGAWVHELQHRYDKRLQRELFRGTLYTLVYERRALKAEAIALGLALKADRVSPKKLQPGPEAGYFQHASQARQAYLEGESGPKLTGLARRYFGLESPFRPPEVEEPDQVYARLSGQPRTSGDPAGESRLRIARFEMERGVKLRVPPEDFSRLQALPLTGPDAPYPEPGRAPLPPGTQAPIPHYPAVPAPGAFLSPSTAAPAGLPSQP